MPKYACFSHNWRGDNPCPVCAFVEEERKPGKLTPVETLYEKNAADIPKMLRLLADELEQFPATSVAVVVDSPSGLDVRLFGPTPNPGADAYLLFHAGAAKMMEAAMEAKVR